MLVAFPFIIQNSLDEEIKKYIEMSKELVLKYNFYFVNFAFVYFVFL